MPIHGDHHDQPDIPPPNPHPAAGLEFCVARTVDEVVDAWRLVYRCYLSSGLIHPNPARVHTVPQAISGDSAVIRGTIAGVTVATFSIYADGPDGLPLDEVYPEYFAQARDQGVVPVEFGLFADRRQHMYRSINAMIELMRYAVFFGVYLPETTDGFLGVHPKHVRFWTRLFGFEVAAEQRSYAVVRDNPVVLLRYRWQDKLANRENLGRGVSQILDNPVDLAEFEQRVDLNAQSIAGTPIERFFAHQSQAAPKLRSA